jgi:endonuclease/exonuclease/phosphatase (EEP) superfamily protein YafD
VKLARALSALAAAGFILVVLLSFVPVWQCALLEHFRVQYLLVGIAIVAVARSLAPQWFDPALVILLLDLIVVAPGMRGAPADHAGKRVRILLSNVLTSNTHYDRIEALVAETKPDVIGLVEPDATWFSHLALPGYTRMEVPHLGNFGIALYARGTLTGGAEYLGTSYPTIVAQVDVGARFTMVLTHPMPPMSARSRDEQFAQFEAIHDRIAPMQPVVIAGDFNATPWSKPFAVIANGLCDTRNGYQGSFPTSSAIIRIPIDHVLVTCGVGVHDRWVGPDVGSDHLPVIVDLDF